MECKLEICSVCVFQACIEESKLFSTGNGQITGVSRTMEISDWEEKDDPSNH